MAKFSAARAARAARETKRDRGARNSSFSACIRAAFTQEKSLDCTAESVHIR